MNLSIRNLAVQIAVLLIISLSSCQKESGGTLQGGDIRQAFEGEYRFERHINEWYDGAPPNFDTSFTQGYVKVDSVFLKSWIVKCGDGITPFVFKWDEYFTFKYNIFESYKPPHYIKDERPHHYFEYKFVGYDSLYIYLYSGGLGGGGGFEYFGSKIK